MSVACSPIEEEVVQPIRERRPAVDTVLVADPDEVLRRSICDVMRRAGFRVLAQAENSLEARGLTRKLEPCVLVLGQPDTGLEAFELTRYLRSMQLAGVVLLSPVPNVEWIRAAQVAGVDVLLGRPPREADLVAAVQMSFGRRLEAAHLQTELDMLKDRLETGTLVQRAKELLMRRDSINETEAYQRLRRQAERSGRPLKSIAEAVVLAASVAPAM